MAYRIMVIALAAFIGGGCGPVSVTSPGSVHVLVPAVRMYAGPERPEEAIAILTAARSALVRIDAVGGVKWVGDPATKDSVEFMLHILFSRSVRPTHVLDSASIDAADGKKVNTRGYIHVLPGVHEIQGSITPCWDGSRPRPAARAFSVSVDVKPGRRYVIGSLYPTGPTGLGRPSWYQPIVIGDDGTKQGREHVGALGTVVSCDG
jgi:hypothetical protein